MVLGLSRPKWRSYGGSIFPPNTASQPSPPAHDWLHERGDILFESTVDILGGFPGYADRGARLNNVDLRITENYLLIDEGLSCGFGLPISWIERVLVVSQPLRDEFALRIFYRDSSTPRLFTLLFKSARLPARGIARAIKAQDALHLAGAPRQMSEAPPPEPNFTLPWDQTRNFESENVIWTGRSIAPISVGRESVESDVWLTTRSLIWGSGEGAGINRIPLALLMDLVSIRLRDRVGTPAVYVAIGDGATGRYELPFIFDLQSPPDRNFRERGAFLVGLRSRGLPDGASAPVWQPWRTTINLLAATDHMLANDRIVLSDEKTHLPAPELPLMPETFDAYQTWPGMATESPVRDVEEPLAIRRRGRLGDRLGRLVLPAEAPAAISPEVGPAPLVVVNQDPRKTSDDTDRLPTEFQTDHNRDVILAEHTATSAAPQISQEDIPTGESLLPVISNENAPDSAVAELKTPAREVEDEKRDVVVTSRARPRENSVLLAASPPRLLAPAIADTDGWSAIRRYESTAVGSLAEALRVIDDRIAQKMDSELSEAAPSSLDQARAIDQISALVTSGEITVDDGRKRRERLLILGDVTVRLRTIIDLYQAGHLNISELEAKRARLTTSLADVLAPGMK